MDDEQAELLDDSSLIQVESSYQSEESRFSEDSYAVNEDLMEANSYDDWEDDAYYDMSRNYDDTTYESLPLILREMAEDAFQQTPVPPNETINVCEDSLEENNNDPNNNMDSIEIPNAEESLTIMEYSSESGIVADRADSPRPGCSKDSLPLRSADEDESRVDDEATLERTRHILRLISTIHRDSVFEALKKNPKMSVSDLKLWDLLPHNGKFEYPKQLSTRPSKPETVISNAAVEDFTRTESFAASNAATFAAASTVKRGPAEDICTVGCKKSSSDPDISIALPKLPTSVPTLKAPSLIPQPAGKTIFQVAKARRENPPLACETYRVTFQFPPAAVGSATAGTAQLVNPGSPTMQKIVNVNTTAPNNSKGAIPKVRVEGHKQPQQQREPTFEKVTNQQQQQQQQVRGAEAHGSRPTSANFQNQEANFVKPLIGRVIAPREQAVTNQLPNNPARVSTVARSLAMIRANATAGVGSVTVVPIMNVIPAKTTALTTSQENSQQQQQEQQQQSTNKVICMEIYYKLRNIFPNVDPDYIKKLCPPNWGPGDRDAQLAPMVEHLLQEGDNLPRAPVKLSQFNDEATGQGAISCGNVDDIYETLLGIFPDADPHYLREFSERNVSKPNAVKEFVESKLESRDYPTREQYMARLKITEQQRQYTTGFDVKQYLTIIPDPFKHFMDPNRKCQHKTVASEFLKSHFNKIKVATIARAYDQCSYNLSATAEVLSHTGCEMKSKRATAEIPTEDILLLQEMAFIKHKTEISDYMDRVKRAEEAEFKMLKEQNFLVECQCCYDSECVPSKCSSCDNGHLFCNNCVINGTSSKMGEGETRISCFANCGSEFSLSVLQRVLAPTTFSILLKKRQAAEVIEAGLEGLVSCPFCHFSSIPPEEDKVFKCLNPECTKESCRLCKELSHVPLKCNEVLKADNARRYIEERMTQALARKCYKCQRAFFKEEGCNKITCPCGAQMCYLCDQPIVNYTHFRGQGSDAKNLCPLYSDTIRLDAVAVRKVAEEAQMEVMKLNPSVKVDTTKLLPAIPRPSHGPHTAIFNADELPRRAQRRGLELQPL